MGTRADFYVGRGVTAEWLGSIAYDGYPDGIPDGVLDARDESAFRSAVKAFLAERDDATHPEQGWPWPWVDSSTNNYGYCFDASRVWWHDFNPYDEDSNYEDTKRGWVARADQPFPGVTVEFIFEEAAEVWPNMKDRQVGGR